MKTFVVADDPWFDILDKCEEGSSPLVPSLPVANCRLRPQIDSTPLPPPGAVADAHTLIKKQYSKRPPSKGLDKQVDLQREKSY